MRAIFEYLEAMRRTRWLENGHPWFTNKSFEHGSLHGTREVTFCMDQIITTERAPVRVSTMTWMRSSPLLVRYLSVHGIDWDFYASYDLKDHTVDIFRLNGERAMSQDIMALILGL